MNIEISVKEIFRFFLPAYVSVRIDDPAMTLTLTDRLGRHLCVPPRILVSPIDD